ncbi:uncharacterized protein E0L32_003053 [Thyridium curvatum]|uniref:Uncharacterized protein n=1 Tax=Thyridium curvatum TaxID=1093900 RepID=A0A507BL08_9PEZI|nr:uncharacterized protein E0L32_003053 [Thyridium curvatum]TPX17410.1 hypothetical protein E0L32_003053 [Thyridium curvatum]
MAVPTENEQLPVVETPTSPSSAFALSRFEFETDKGNEGTKILMVEWDTSVGGEQSAEAQKAEADWEVSWEGKTTVLPARDPAPLSGSENGPEMDTDTRRVYFLLPPGAPIPPLVNISQRGKGGTPGATVLRTKPMPAIFPKELGASSHEEGHRGVLHSIWAKKRLSELQAEIAKEMRLNGEGIGLEMALQEKQWIEEQFGVGDGSGSGGKAAESSAIPPTPASPTSPRSPIGGKLGEKLRGLKLATSPEGLAAATEASKTKPQPHFNSLSPQAADMAVPSFHMFPGRAAPKVSAGPEGVASLDAIIGGDAPAAPAAPGKGSEETEEELFALPMSPRSPEMKKSPFSLLK